jgi:hypothetical protein
MKLTLQLKLLPTSDQHTAVLETMHTFNAAASHAARVGFEAGVFTQLSIHRRCYREGLQALHPRSGAEVAGPLWLVVTDGGASHWQSRRGL